MTKENPWISHLFNPVIILLSNHFYPKALEDTNFTQWYQQKGSRSGFNSPIITLPGWSVPPWKNFSFPLTIRMILQESLFFQKTWKELLSTNLLKSKRSSEVCNFTPVCARRLFREFSVASTNIIHLFHGINYIRNFHPIVLPWSWWIKKTRYTNNTVIDTWKLLRQ